jgi:hypothetical protein
VLKEISLLRRHEPFLSGRLQVCNTDAEAWLVVV